METTVNDECIKCCKVCSTCMYGPKDHHQVFSFSNGNPAGRQQHGMLKAAWDARCWSKARWPEDYQPHAFLRLGARCSMPFGKDGAIDKLTNVSGLPSKSLNTIRVHQIALRIKKTSHTKLLISTPDKKCNSPPSSFSSPAPLPSASPRPSRVLVRLPSPLPLSPHPSSLSPLSSPTCDPVSAHD